MSDAFLRGKEYLEGGCFEGAIAELEFAILNNKYLWDAYYFLSKAYLEQAKDSRDKELLLKSSYTLQCLETLNPEYDRLKTDKLKREIREISRLLGFPMIDEAAIAEAAIAEDPHEVVSHSKLSKSLKEGPSTRIMRFKKIVDSDPANILALSQLGRAYEDSENFNLAQTVYERMLQHALGLELATGLYESEENLKEALRWWADYISSQRNLDRESLELIYTFYRLSRLLTRRGELSKACLMFSGAIDLAINLSALLLVKHLFNEFFSSCIQAGKFKVPQERFPFINTALEQVGEQSLLDPILVSLIQSRPKED